MPSAQQAEPTPQRPPEAEWRDFAWPHRLTNLIGRVLPIDVPLSERHLIAAAQRVTGLSDWGDDSFRTPLRFLLESCRRDARLSFGGALMARGELVRCLANRLCIRDDLKRHPDIADVPVPRPLVITGMARTGTTLLHRLLAEDPAARTLRLWEMLSPSLPPPGVTRDADPRRPAMRRAIERRKRFLYTRRGLARALAVHPGEHDDAEECSYLFLNTLMASRFCVHAKLDGYRDWLRGQDMGPAYRYFRLQMQMLLKRQSRPRLVLKAPMHLRHLDALFGVFPDARIVWLHRDPLRVVPSLCDLLAAARCVRSDTVNPPELGPAVLRATVDRVGRGLAVRDAVGESVFLDVQYRDLVRDPLATIARICAFDGRTLTPDAEARMRQWLDTRGRPPRGSRRYRLETFGLAEADVLQPFQPYCERFGIAMARPDSPHQDQ